MKKTILFLIFLPLFLAGCDNEIVVVPSEEPVSYEFFPDLKNPNKFLCQIDGDTLGCAKIAYTHNGDYPEPYKYIWRVCSSFMSDLHTMLVLFVFRSPNLEELESGDYLCYRREEQIYREIKALQPQLFFKQKSVDGTYGRTYDSLIPEGTVITVKQDGDDYFIDYDDELDFVTNLYNSEGEVYKIDTISRHVKLKISWKLNYFIEGYFENDSLEYPF